MRKCFSTVTITFFAILVTITLLSCTEVPREGTEPPKPPENVWKSVLAWGREPTEPDDLVPTPVGFNYAAGIHDFVKPDKWPPVEMTSLDYDWIMLPVQVSYRSTIHTRAGQVKPNIVFVERRPITLGPFQYFPEIHKSIITASGVPNDITIWHNGETGPVPGNAVHYILVQVSNTAKPGDYSFNIGIDVNDHFYGTLPCTITVS